jgi:pimeloyl-ACP methyl ester carboxylesterase
MLEEFMYQAPLLDRVWSRIINLLGFKSHFIGAGESRLHVFVAEGTGQLPPVLLVHGIGANAASFGPTMKFLKANFRKIIALDFPGHGLSAPLPFALDHEGTFAVTAASLRGFIDEPIFIFGNSMGGGFSMYFAERYLEMMLGVILCSPLGAPMEQAKLKNFIAQFELNTLAEARAFAGKLTDWMPAPIAWIMAPFVRKIFSGKTIRTIFSRFTPEHSVKPHQLASLKMPLLFLWGKVERLMPEAHFDYFAAHLPSHAVIERPERFGHCPHLDHPAKVASRITDFAIDVTSRWRFRASD